jgi:4-hydroxy-3-polyprenylbenzoate decarboxylase
MEDQRLKLIIGVTGASGAIYANVLLDRLIRLEAQVSACGVLFSDNAKGVWEHELGNRDFEKLPFKSYEPGDFYAPFASGSAGYDAMIVCPCSMGTLGRIASGVSNDLMTRAADVMLKERRKLVLVIRETPYNLIHIRNMETVTIAGGVIVPATPSFYSKPKNFEELASTVVDRALALAGLQMEGFQWGK